MGKLRQIFISIASLALNFFQFINENYMCSTMEVTWYSKTVYYQILLVYLFNFNFATDVVASMKKKWDRFCETTSLSSRKMANHNASFGNCNRILVKFMFWFQSSFEKLSILQFPYCLISMIISYISYLFLKNGDIVQSYQNQVGRIIIDEHFSEAKKQTAISWSCRAVICMLCEYGTWVGTSKFLVIS